MKAVALLSGGLDSTVLAYDLHNQGYDLHLLSFDYGQRHRKELAVAAETAKDLGASHHIIVLETLSSDMLDILPLASVLGGSALTDETLAVPDGHYAEDNMKVTVVPNRNAIMLSIAYGVAVAEKADLVCFAAHSGDHRIYPDCRPEFVALLNTALRVGNAWSASDRVPELRGPYLNKSKAEIVGLGQILLVPFQHTWSCYKGGDIHCGTCGTCYERREAFKLAGIEDPTVYLDDKTEYAAPI